MLVLWVSGLEFGFISGLKWMDTNGMSRRKRLAFGMAFERTRMENWDTWLGV